MNISLKEVRQNIGISLIFTGIAISMYLKYFVSGGNLTPITMLISCLLLCDKTTFRNRMTWNMGFHYLFIFQLVMLFYLFFTFNSQSDSTITKQLGFHLYVISLIFVLGRTHSLRSINYIPYLFVISSILSIIGLICHQLNLFELDRMLHKDEGPVLEVFTVNAVAYVNFICCMLILNTKKRILLLLLFLMLAIDFYIIVNSGKRSYFMSVVASIMFYLYKKKRMGQGLILMIITTLTLFVFVPEFQEMVITIVNRTITGFSDVYVSQSHVTDWDDSASIRVYLQKLALQKFYDFNLLNIIFGGGYLCQFFDNPLVESYLDMGFVGLISFFYLIVLFPFVYINKIKCNDKIAMLPFYLSLMNICIIITNNDPYNYTFYTPICLMSLYFYQRKKQYEKN